MKSYLLGIAVVCVFLAGLYVGAKISKPAPYVSAVPYAPIVETKTVTKTIIKTRIVPGGCETVVTQDGSTVVTSKPESVNVRSNPKYSVGVSYRPMLRRGELLEPEEVGVSASTSIAGSPVHLEIGGHYIPDQHVMKPEVGFRYIK